MLCINKYIHFERLTIIARSILYLFRFTLYYSGFFGARYRFFLQFCKVRWWFSSFFSSVIRSFRSFSLLLLIFIPSALFHSSCSFSHFLALFHLLVALFVTILSKAHTIRFPHFFGLSNSTLDLNPFSITNIWFDKPFLATNTQLQFTRQRL